MPTLGTLLAHTGPPTVSLASYGGARRTVSGPAAERPRPVCAAGPVRPVDPDEDKDSSTDQDVLSGRMDVLRYQSAGA